MLTIFREKTFNKQVVKKGESPQNVPPNRRITRALAKKLGASQIDANSSKSQAIAKKRKVSKCTKKQIVSPSSSFLVSKSVN